jgi:acetylornithine deacetylase/succinyl-diaminopimelate desuccinylase-like protein
VTDDRPAPMSSAQEAWVEAACSSVTVDALTDLVSDLASIPSPTGEERPLAEFIVEYARGQGLAARYQPIDAKQGNALAWYGGPGDGPDLLLYAPIDTLTTGSAEEDCPWVGSEIRPDMEPQARPLRDWVIGLGASNPKGHAACVIAATAAISRAQVPLRGSLLLGLGAGGMPTNKRTTDRIDRFNAGQGAGCSFMLEQGTQADYAIIAKPGWAVDYEEVGLCWFRVDVKGTFSYAGSRHRIAYKNPIVDAALVIRGLEDWFAEYSRANTSGLVCPQGNIGAIEGGWQRTASLSPALCRLLVDLRISPRTTPMDAKRQFQVAMADIVGRNPGLDVDWEMVLAIPGTTTPPDNWIVGSCVRAWENLEERPHKNSQLTSGATDANILRHRGIPTARIGMPKVSDPTGREVDFPMGMNAVDPREMVRLTRLIVRSAIDTCTRSCEEISAR